VVPFPVLPQTVLACCSRQPFCFHILVDSLSSPKKSTPVESSKYRLFPQNTRGGGYRKNCVCGINNIQTLFSGPVCKSVTPPPLGVFLCASMPPWRSNLPPSSQPLRQLRALCASALSFVFALSPFVFTTMRTPGPATLLFSHPYKTPGGAHQVRLPWLPSPILPPTQISPNLPFTRSDVPTSATVRWRSNV